MAVAKQSKTTWHVFKKFGSYSQLVRVLTWAKRFLNNYYKLQPSIKSNHLTYKELSDTKMYLIRVQQHLHFPEVFDHLKRKKHLPENHSLAGLSVSVDDDNALVVTGRVRQQQTRTPRRMWPLSTVEDHTRSDSIHACGH